MSGQLKGRNIKLKKTHIKWITVFCEDNYTLIGIDALLREKAGVTGWVYPCLVVVAHSSLMNVFSSLKGCVSEFFRHDLIIIVGPQSVNELI
jgi:hypothetical protein